MSDEQKTGNTTNPPETWTTPFGNPTAPLSAEQRAKEMLDRLWTEYKQRGQSLSDAEYLKAIAETIRAAEQAVRDARDEDWMIALADEVDAVGFDAPMHSKIGEDPHVMLKRLATNLREQSRAETQAAVQEMKERAADYLGNYVVTFDGRYVTGEVQQEIHALPTPTDALVKALRERDGEWIDAIEDALHFGVVPETMEAAMQAAKDWLVEHDEKVLSAQLPTLREHDARVLDKAFERLWELMQDGWETQKAMDKVKEER